MGNTNCYNQFKIIINNIIYQKNKHNIEKGYSTWNDNSRNENIWCKDIEYDQYKPFQEKLIRNINSSRPQDPLRLWLENIISGASLSHESKLFYKNEINLINKRRFLNKELKRLIEKLSKKYILCKKKGLYSDFSSHTDSSIQNDLLGRLYYLITILEDEKKKK